MNVTYRIRLFTRCVITWATRRVPQVEQHLLTLPEHLRLPIVFGGVRVAYSIVFYVVSWVLLFVCLSFLAMALSVYFRFMSLTVPLVSFVPLWCRLYEIHYEPFDQCICSLNFIMLLLVNNWRSGSIFMKVTIAFIELWFFVYWKMALYVHFRAVTENRSTYALII